jgi:hypothetical protein
VTLPAVAFPYEQRDAPADLPNTGQGLETLLQLGQSPKPFRIPDGVGIHAQITGLHRRLPAATSVQQSTGHGKRRSAADTPGRISGIRFGLPELDRTFRKPANAGTIRESLPDVRRRINKIGDRQPQAIVLRTKN